MADNNRMATLEEAIAVAFTREGEHPSDRGLITAWLVVAEVMGDDGRPYLKRVISDGTPAWRIIGMLGAILDNTRDGMRSRSDT